MPNFSSIAGLEVVEKFVVGWGHCKLLQLILARLDKLQGKAEPHSEEVEWWRTFMVE